MKKILHVCICLFDLVVFFPFSFFTNICFCPCRAKYAIGAIKKKLNDKNPHVALYALEVRHALEEEMLDYFSSS